MNKSSGMKKQLAGNIFPQKSLTAVFLIDFSKWFWPNSPLPALLASAQPVSEVLHLPEELDVAPEPGTGPVLDAQLLHSAQHLPCLKPGLKIVSSLFIHILF